MSVSLHWRAPSKPGVNITASSCVDEDKNEGELMKAICLQLLLMVEDLISLGSELNS